MATRRKPLEPWQREDAERLRQLWDKKRPGSQEEFGDRFGIGTQGAVWQYLAARMPLNAFVAAKFARGLGCTIDDISPKLAMELREIVPELAAAKNERAISKAVRMLTKYEALDEEMRGVVDSLLNRPESSRKRA